jgi:hypothetical protein
MGPALAPGVVIGADRGPGGGARAASGLPGGMMPMGGAGGRGAAKGTGSGSAKGGYVAPPGGLIGGRPQAGKSNSGAVPTAGTAGSRRRRQDGEDGWTVAAGVPGVLLPDPEPDEHDPGPGVIGIDR